MTGCPRRVFSVDILLNAQSLNLYGADRVRGVLKKTEADLNRKSPTGLEVETEGNLTGPVSAVLSALNTLNDAKRRRRHVRWRRAKFG